MVTGAPKRAMTWPISRPTAPPPTTSNDPGTVSVAMASRFVQCGMSANMGGTQARAPVARTSAVPAVISSPSTSTDEALVSRARPRMKCPPLPTKRSTATVSSQESVASSRMRRATGAQSGVIDRRAGVARNAAALGQQIGRPHHHFGGDAAPIRALTADELGLDAHDVESGLGQLAGYLFSSRSQPDHDGVAVALVYSCPSW